MQSIICLKHFKIHSKPNRQKSNNGCHALQAKDNDLDAEVGNQGYPPKVIVSYDECDFGIPSPNLSKHILYFNFH